MNKDRRSGILYVWRLCCVQFYAFAWY